MSTDGAFENTPSPPQWLARILTHVLVSFRMPISSEGTVTEDKYVTTACQCNLLNAPTFTPSIYIRELQWDWHSAESETESEVLNSQTNDSEFESDISENDTDV